MLPILAIGLKVFLTAAMIVSATLAAERMRPVWGGIIATIPLSSGAAHVMLAMNEDAAFVSQAALGSLVTSIAAFIYLLVFVTLAPRLPAFAATACAFLSWLTLSLSISAIGWTAPVAMLANLIAFAATFALTRRWRAQSGEGRKTKPTRSEILWRGFAAGLLATTVSVTARLVGPTIAGLLAVFPVVYVSVAYIVHSRMGGESAALTMAAAVLPLVGVALTFLTLSMMAPILGSWPAIACAFVVSLAWPAGVALYHISAERRLTA